MEKKWITILIEKHFEQKYFSSELNEEEILKNMVCILIKLILKNLILEIMQVV